MAITIINEINYVDVVTTVLISPFMNPVLYFKVSGASAIAAPKAEIDIRGTSEIINIEAVYEKTESEEHYFIVDLSEVLKYVLRRFDGIERPDDLICITDNTLQGMEYAVSVYVDIYFERGTANEQKDVITTAPSYFISRPPYNNGFHLHDFFLHVYLQDQKWTLNTYNAIFFRSLEPSASIDVNGVEVANAATTYKFYQYKFGKTITPLIKGRNEVTINTAVASKTFYIDYDPDDTCSKCLCWQHPQLGYVSYPFEGAMATQTDVSAGAEVGKLLTTMVNVGQLKEQMGYKKTKRVTLWTKAESKYWPLLEELYNSRHVYLFVGESGADDTAATWLECRVSGGYSDVSNRHSKVFSVDLTLPEQYTISF